MAHFYYIAFRFKRLTFTPLCVFATSVTLFNEAFYILGFLPAQVSAYFKSQARVIFNAAQKLLTDFWCISWCAYFHLFHYLYLCIHVCFH